jgi:electron transport complex protein RnfD
LQVKQPPVRPDVPREYQTSAMPVTGSLTTNTIMWRVCAALLPGALLSVWFFGLGVVMNLVLVLVMATACEAACLKARGKPAMACLRDGSTVVTALILTLCMPPSMSVGILALAVCGAVVLAKHLYGGLGHNIFNPAMVGYALALVSFPDAMASWPGLDGMSGATPLTTFRYREGLSVAELWNAANGFGVLGAAGWEWVNVAYLAGGLLLWRMHLIAWRVPLAMLGTLTLLALIFYDGGSSASAGSPAYHLFSAGTMLAAFFVLTDPVTHPATRRSQLVFGALAGIVIFAVRAWGNYPDGIAFAVLLANAATPFLNRVARTHRDSHDQVTG